MKQSQWTAAAPPKYCCWVLTYQCMFKCRMCHIWQTKNERTELDLSEKKRFVKSLVEFVEPNFEFHLSGGEPLMVPEIFELIHFIRACGFKVNLVTNGWLIDEQVARRLIEAGLSTLTLSLDGMAPGTHDYLRGCVGAHHRVMNAIRKVAAIRAGAEEPSIALLTVISGYNLREIELLADWVAAMPDIDMISFQAVTQPFSDPRNDTWYQTKEGSVLWPRDRRLVASVMNELRHRRLAGEKIGNHPNHFRAFKRYFDDPAQFVKETHCNLGDYEFHVDPYGKIFFCCGLEPIGMLGLNTVPELWVAPRTQAIREKVYRCRKNCHIMVNCFYEDEHTEEEKHHWYDGIMNWVRTWAGSEDF